MRSFISTWRIILQGDILSKSLNEDDLVREYIAPEGDIQKSSFFEAINTRGLEQLIDVFES